MKITKVGIVGAGQMGSGIAHVFALAGFDVTLNDISPDALASSIEIMKGNMSRQVGRGKITDDQMQAALRRITTTSVLADLGPSDLIIEAATE
ncbi:MAG TPA: 3-hydroxybutyryl-CoA dehydrogenase, partial [Rhodobacteraceae bacterium]|nr:3-hydroxybutyryl-CoA dehydrogenase [Paracoccaceae bacterium]